ncbi:MAG: nitronate monooxygenase [Myxococcales bacterium]|nr:nitronate monooxygenase [Myxococcales bacterium]
MKTELCKRLGIDVPIFAFSHCRDVVAAVSRAGGLGVLGAVAYSPAQLELELKWIDEHTDGKPYGVDTVIPAKYIGKGEGGYSKEQLEQMITPAHRKWINDLLDKYGVPPLPDEVEHFEGLLGWSEQGGRAHFEVAMSHDIALIANALGPPPEDIISHAHDKGVLVAALCGSVHQALKQKSAGVDIVIASGYEAGGHTGEIASMVLTPQVVDAVAPTPVLAAGGIGSGRQMAAAMALGAQGVWTGSIWLTTQESDAIPALKRKLVAADSTQTVRSRAISGKPARQLVTEYTKAWESEDCPGYLPMPLQFLATADATQRITRHAQSGAEGSDALLGTAVGQVVGQMNAERPVSKVVYDLVEEYVSTIERLKALLDD